MEKELVKIFDGICKQNDEIIENPKTESIIPTCIIMKDDGTEIIGLTFNGYEQKVIMREMLFKKILSQKIKGYIIIFDSKMTSIDKSKKGQPIVKDCCIRSIYSPNGEQIKEMAIYENHKIESKKRFDSKDKKQKEFFESMRDEWNIFGKHFDEENKKDRKINEEYQKFKQEHKDLYKEVD